MSSNLTDLRLAVLIDAENVPRRRMKAIIQELTLYGTPTIKRIYGDWTSPNLSNWKQELLENAIQPIQQHSYTTGKNSSDSAMIIDAMDILYAGHTDGFCIVSSDSDFTRLATRLRESGMKVIGVGEKKTPSSFIAACDKFIYIEVLAQQAEESEEQRKKQVLPSYQQPRRNYPQAQPEHDEHEPQNTEPIRQSIPQEVERLVIQSVKDLADEDGYAFLGEIGNLLLKKQPDFDPRNFGFNKLTPMIQAMGKFEIDVRQTASPNIKHIYVKLKE
jgi:uncharacterized LabA/DUF88 family protein/Fe-S-cluster formation regulator IscX/YfhJ